jgi:hypothetical protein
MNTNHCNVIIKYWQFISLVTGIVLAVIFAARNTLTQALDPRSPSTISLNSNGLTYNLDLRTTLTNLGNACQCTKMTLHNLAESSVKRMAISQQSFTGKHC